MSTTFGGIFRRQPSLPQQSTREVLAHLKESVTKLEERALSLEQQMALVETWLRDTSNRGDALAMDLKLAERNRATFERDAERKLATLGEDLGQMRDIMRAELADDLKRLVIERMTPKEGLQRSLPSVVGIGEVFAGAAGIQSRHHAAGLDEYIQHLDAELGPERASNWSKLQKKVSDALATATIAKETAHHVASVLAVHGNLAARVDALEGLAARVAELEDQPLRVAAPEALRSFGAMLRLSEVCESPSETPRLDARGEDAAQPSLSCKTCVAPHPGASKEAAAKPSRGCTSCMPCGLRQKRDPDSAPATPVSLVPARVALRPPKCYHNFSEDAEEGRTFLSI